RKRGIAARDPAIAARRKLAQIRRGVERRAERGEARGAWRLEEMRIRLRGEDRGRELVHSVSSRGGRYESASPMCSGCTSSEPARVATVAATRATRARPAPGNGS